MVILATILLLPSVPSVVQIQPDPIVINVNTGSGGADGNASSICTGTEVLLGNSSCLPIAEIASIADTNETFRFGLLTENDCGAGNLVIGVQANGTLLCATDSGGGHGDPYDQSLNTTDQVTFNNVTVLGTLDINHTANQDDDHAVEIDVFASGFADIKAIFINYITGALGDDEDDEVIFINIDQFEATGGDITGLEIVTTEGSANVIGMETGILVDPIEQLSGVFSSADSYLNESVNANAAFTSLNTNISIFSEDDATITIGNAEKFEELEFILEVAASGSGISPTFEYSGGGVNNWTFFTPTDGTNGLRNTGIVLWLDSDIPNWNTNGSEYLIRMTRTKNTVATDPIEGIIQIAVGELFFWDKLGNLLVNNINSSSWRNVTITESQISDLVHTDIWDALFNDTFDTRDVGGGNNSFNQSLTDGLYADITFSYNQSAPYDTFNYNMSLAYDTFNYNQTAGAKTYSDSLSHPTIWDALFNDTFDTRDQSGTGNVSWNESRANALYADITFSYNQSAPYDTFNYNQTAGSKIYSDSLNHPTIWDALFNTTFDGRDQSSSTPTNGVELLSANITDLNHTSNETFRFGLLTENDCGVGNLVIGIQANGTVLCAADADTGGDPFDQLLNKNATVQFVTVNASTDIRSDVFRELEGNLLIDGSDASGSETFTFDGTGIQVGGGNFDVDTTTFLVGVLANCNTDIEKLETSADGTFSCGAIPAIPTIWDALFNDTFDTRDQTGTGNVSWNESRANALYADITFSYNQSAPYDTFNYNMSLAYDTFNYNQTAGSKIYSDSLNHPTIWDALFNTTFDDRDQSTSFNPVNVAYFNNSQIFAGTNTFTPEQLYTTGVNITEEANMSIGASRTSWNGTCLNTYVHKILIQSIGCL